MEIKLLDIKKEIDSLSPALFNCKNINSTNLKFLKISRKNINVYFKVNKKEYIFRVNIKGYNSCSSKNSKKEYNNLNILNKYTSDSVPQEIYFSEKGNYFPCSYIIITYLKGKDTIINKSNIKVIAKKIAIVNKTQLSFKDRFLIFKQDFTNLRSEFIRKENYISQYNLSLSELLKKIRLNIEMIKPQGLNKDLYLVHGDLSLKNIISDSKNINLIDWEYLRYASPLLDIAKLSHSKNFIKYEKDFFKEYTKNFNNIENIYDKYLFYRDFQIYLWLISSTKYYFEIVFEDYNYSFKNSKKNIVKDIIKNYQYLYKKGYANLTLEKFKKILHI